MVFRKRLCSLLLATALSAGICPVSLTASAEPGEQKGNDMEASKDRVSYTVVGTDNNDGSYIVSGYNVKDFGAAGDGVADDTGAIEAALSAARSAGGALVYLPAGKYRITRPGLCVAGGVTLFGQWNDPGLGTDKPQSILVADYPAGEDVPLINLQTESSLLNLCIYYPRQSVEAPAAYSYALSTDLGSGWYANKVTVKNVTFYNAYRGLEGAGSGQHFSHIYGTVLSEGIHIGSNAEVSEILYIGFNAGFWSGYDGTDAAAIRAYTKANATALRFGRCDDYLLYEVDCPADSFARGVYFEVGTVSAGSEYQTGIAYGGCYQLHGTEVSFGEGYADATPAGWPVNCFLDDIPGTDSYSFAEPAERHSTKSDLFNVRDFGAKGDGRNDTEAFENALSAAGANGGGIVFVPSGSYSIYRSLTVPENVEILGESYGYRLGSPSVIRMKKASEFTDALFVLSEGSGVQGLCIRQPDNSQEAYTADCEFATELFPEERAAAIAKTPYVFRGNGQNCYVENVSIVNCNYGFDFASAECDNFVVRGIWATCMDEGIRIGGGSRNGRLSCLFFSYGPWWEDEGCKYSLEAYTRNTTEAFIFEDCKDVQCFSLGCFAVKNALVFQKTDSGAPENISILRAVCDMAYGKAAITFDAGDRISVLFASTGITGEQKRLGRTGGALYVTDSFEGIAYVYGQNLWAGGSNQLSRSVKLYTEKSAAADVQTIDHGFTAPDYSYRTEDDPPETSPTEAPEEPAPSSGIGKWLAAAGTGFFVLGGGAALLFRKKRKK